MTMTDTSPVIDREDLSDDLESLNDQIASLERAIKSLRCELDEVEFALAGVNTAFEDVVKNIK
jgi:hypothetical protein